MTLFLSAVLAAAAFQSFCKLALLPRRWELLAAALLLPLPFLFEQRLAQTSLAAVTASLSGAATLENWCALVVIQELFSLIAVFPAYYLAAGSILLAVAVIVRFFGKKTY